MAEWRVGRSVGRTLYLDGKLIGLVDTPELAAEIVETMNRLGNLLDEVRAELPAGAVWVEPGGSFAMNASSEPTRPTGGVIRDSRLFYAPEGPEGCGCTVAHIVGTPHEQPADAQRRSEATPQKDLSEDIDVEHFGTPGPVWTSARRRVNVDHDLSRVDPYDTKKGFGPDPQEKT